MDGQNLGRQVGDIDLGTQNARFDLCLGQKLFDLDKCRQPDADRAAGVDRQQLLAVEKQHCKFTVVFAGDVEPLRSRQLIDVTTSKRSHHATDPPAIFLRPLLQRRVGNVGGLAKAVAAKFAGELGFLDLKIEHDPPPWAALAQH